MAASTSETPAESENEALIAQWGLAAREVPLKGRGVFVGRPVPARSLVLKFEGPVFTKDTCPDFSEAIQVRAGQTQCDASARARPWHW